jgi:hypothetical protein
MSVGKKGSPGYRGRERRGAQSKPAQSMGEILIPDQPSIPCRVLEISAAGARIGLNTSLGVPQNFELRVEGVTYRAQVVRRLGRILLIFFS